MELAVRIEAILFYEGEPVKRADLVRLTGNSLEEVRTALEVLTASLSGRGIRLILTDEDACLVTAPELSEMIETMRKEELKRDIGKAGAETLAIVLYRGPISRADIDYIRGVNSSFILRNLIMRGLVLRKENEKSARTFVYSASSELYAELGISRREELPDYESILTRLDTFEKERTDATASVSDTSSI